MKRISVGFIIVAVLSVFFLYNCGGKDQGEAPREIPAASERLVISGSATTIPIIEKLAEAYKLKKPELITDFLPSSHTGGGIQGAQSGELSLGAISRDLEEEEKNGLVEFIFARDAIVFVANRNVRVKNITSGQLKQIYSGKITRWSQIGQEGLKDEDIVVIDRPSHSSPKIVLGEKLFTGDFVLGTNLVMVERALDTNEALIKTPNSLGYTSLAAIKMGDLPLSTLAVDGVEPTPENVRTGAYPYYRPLGVVYRSDPDKAVLGFVEFVMSNEGREIITANGLSPTDQGPRQ